ncbi:hypothetical protein GCM10023079_56800 [Streptomyces chitinivorans]
MNPLRQEEWRGTVGESDWNKGGSRVLREDSIRLEEELPDKTP